MDIPLYISIPFAVAFIHYDNHRRFWPCVYARGRRWFRCGSLDQPHRYGPGLPSASALREKGFRDAMISIFGLTAMALFAALFYWCTTKPHATELG
ncbi:hypothetical protein LCGC14_0322740 [marine sediment metagenome]|uniref:Uncharacterized protein n=1 Tax=marine sediment metagenome TaxID=412755 RepID=A0A0F9TII6_9ZZZZ